MSSSFSWNIPEILQGNPSVANTFFEEMLASHVSLANFEIAKKRCDFFDREDLSPEDFQELPISLSNKEKTLTGWAGIRFRNLDPNTPFVACTLFQDPSQVLLDPALQTFLSQMLFEKFRAFEPHGFTLRSFLKAKDVQGDFDIWNTYLFRKLNESLVPKTTIKIEKTTQIKQLDYVRFEAQYQFWRLLNGELSKWVMATSQEEFEDSIAAGLCYTAYNEQKEWVGIVAGLPEDYYGYQGVSTLELFVFPAYQGKGYGQAMQAAFQNELSKNYAVLWGSIYSKNEPSLKTAQVCKRQWVESEYFLPF